MRRESVSVSADLFRYRLDLLEVAAPHSSPVLKATLCTEILTVDQRYRLIIEGRTSSGRRRLFYDNAESPLASRELIGRRCRREMTAAMRWLASQVGVSDIKSLPVLGPQGFREPEEEA